MADHRILVLADDLTGALEVGAKFAAAAVQSQVRAAPNLLPSNLQGIEGAMVVDTETRHAQPSEAARQVYELARAARMAGVSQVYKKTDSTLRGNIAAELAALIEAYEESPLLYVPAYPQLGRTVSNGCLYVHGILVGSTGFAHDAFNPVKESHIPTLLAASYRGRIQSGPVAKVVDFEPLGITICDGETDADVEAAARLFVNSPSFKLAAGPSGFAAHLARQMDFPRSAPTALPCVRNVMIVNGSLHQVSVLQVKRAKQEGFGLVNYSAPMDAAYQNGWTILDPEIGTGDATLDFARTMAKSVCQILRQRPLDALVVFGGDTAFAIIDAIGNPPLHPLGEVMEGIPISRIEAKQLGSHPGHRARDLYLVTKAGSFGPPDVLATIRDLLGKR